MRAATRLEEIQMAENTSGNGGLYFIVGALVVVVGIGVFVYSGGYFGGHGKTTTEQTTTVPFFGGTTTTTTTEKH
jgi:hypothetical protein